MNDKMLFRIAEFVSLMKRRKFPNAESFARSHKEIDDVDWKGNKRVQVTSVKTIRRDIRYLKTELNAPVEYNSLEKGYYLHSDWSMPHLMLSASEALAAMFSNRVAGPFLPLPLQQELGDVVTTIEAAACEPGDIDLGAMESVVVATGATAPPDSAIASTILRAWKDTRRLRMDYRPPNQEPTRREVDIHALFLANGAWYARAWCHLRNNFRSFALHRIIAAELLPEHFARSPVVVAEVAQGKLFDYAYCQDVRVQVAAARASYFKERTWFPGQQVTSQPDGTLDVTYPAIPEPLLIQWVLSFLGDVTVTAPENMRTVIGNAAAAIIQGHAPLP